MNSKLGHTLRTGWLTAIAASFLFATSVAALAQGVGAPYEARDPHTCANTKRPERGAITTALATQYLLCDLEAQRGDMLYLVENLQVTIGAGRPYTRSDSYLHNADTTGTIYPIRGSFNQYQCAKVSAYMENTKRNCTLYSNPKASGSCYKTSFGDWSCDMLDTTNSMDDRQYHLAPPGYAPSAASASRNNPAAARQAVSTKTITQANNGPTGPPNPDFSAMEKYWNISRVEFDRTAHRLYFVAKMTSKNNEADWVINFYDADGIKVIPTNGISVASGDYQRVGDVAKLYFYMPDEAGMKQVKSIVITK